MSKIATSITFVACTLLVSSIAYGQGSTASINGFVNDKSGAIIVGAKVVLTNMADGIVVETKSNSSGLFNFSGVQSGEYGLTIEKVSFKRFVQSGIHLDPGDNRTVRDIKLIPGDTTQTVEVTAEVNMITTDSGEVSSTISSSDIENLSVEGRDVTELLKMLPGMTISGGATYKTNGGDTQNVALDASNVSVGGGLGGYVSNGSFKNGTALAIDGADITDSAPWGAAIQNVNYDMVAEVKVQSGSFTADTARGPVVVNAITKSGTKQYHGSLYAYGRTHQLNAMDALAKAYKISPPRDHQFYPGFNIGGPVKLPLTDWNHNNKLTFFAGGEIYAQRNIYASNTSSSIVRALVPTAGMRSGDFSQAEIQNYLGDQYKTTTSGGRLNCSGPYASLCAVPSTSPTGGKIINGNISAYMDPLSQALVNLLPLPNMPSSGGFNYKTAAFTNNNLWQGRVRSDYALSGRTKIYASYGIEEGVNISYPNGTTTLGGWITNANVGGGQENHIRSHEASVNVNSILSNSSTNEFTVSGAYLGQQFKVRTPALAATNPYPQMIFATGSRYLPALRDGNLPGLLTQDAYFGDNFSNRQNRSVGDNFTKVIGVHVLRAGLFYEYQNIPNFPPSSGAGFYTNGYFSSSNNTASFIDQGVTVYNVGSGSGTTTGINYLANFFEGHLLNFQQANKQVESDLYYWNTAGYVQDHWRVTPHLSVDAGVRLEHITPWRDSHGIGIAVFDPTAYAGGTPSALPGILYHQIDRSVPNGGVPTHGVFVEPRAGLAWDVFGKGKTVLRGGMGLYRQHDSFNDVSNAANTPQGVYSYVASGSSGVQFSTLSQYQNAGSTFKSSFLKDTTGVTTVDPKDDRVPSVITYNFAVDQFLPHGMMFEVAYVGNQTSNLLNNQNGLNNVNALPVGSLFRPFPNTRPDVTGMAPGFIFPFFSPGSCSNTNSSGCGLQNITQAMIDAYRPYPLYNSLLVLKHTLMANYNGLQARYAIRMKKATLNVNYTWGKALTNYWGPDPTNYSNDYMPMLGERHHLFNLAYSYRFGTVTHSRWAGFAINDWMVSGVAGFQSGMYLPAPYNYNYFLSGTIVVPFGETATVNGNTSSCVSVNGCSLNDFRFSQSLLGTTDVKVMPVYTGAPSGTKSNQFMNPDVMHMPTILNNGPYRVPDARGPSYFNTDIALAKSWKVGEKQAVSLRASAFNFLNHPLLSFSSANSSNYTLNYSYTAPSPGNLNALLPTIPNAQSLFGGPMLQDGVSPQKSGRRVLEFSVRYTF